MMLSIDPQALRQYLADNEDAEDLGGEEYTLDLYDVDMPISLDLSLAKGRVDVLAALALRYNEELDGWYLAERIEDPVRIASALSAAIAKKTEK